MFSVGNGLSIQDLIKKEEVRILSGINLIASENYPSGEVRQAVGSVLSSKYAEGYPGNRYYSGCQVVDQVEIEAISLAKQVFGAEHANVQPHSGSQANFAVFQALLSSGDTVLAMSMDSGGHLTHGHKLNFSGKNYNFVFYGVDDSGVINYEQLQELAQEHQPKMIIAGASAYPRVINFSWISRVAKQVGAYFFVDMAHFAGTVAAGLCESPVPFADVVSSTTHKTLRGPRGGMILSRAELSKKIDRAVMPGSQGGQAMNVIAGKALAFAEALSREFGTYQAQVLKNARVLADELLAQEVALVSGGTDNHLLLIDLGRSKNIHPHCQTGLLAEKVLERAGVYVNRNLIPNDPLSPLVTSGLRIGTPAITTLGASEEDMRLIAQVISMILRDGEVALSCDFVVGSIVKITRKLKLPS